MARCAAVAVAVSAVAATTAGAGPVGGGAVATVADLERDRGSGVALVVLDPTGCLALVANGGGRIRARSVGAHPGRIAVDTDASQCTGGSYGTDAQGGGSAIVADATATGMPGSVRLYGLTQAGCNAVDHACDPADVAAGSVSPVPVGAARRTGRRHVDWRYDCRPDYGLLDVPPCPSGSTEAHVTALRAEIGATRLPPGFRDYRGEGHPCHVGAGTTVTVPAGNWLVTCSLSVGGTLAFTGGNLVFQRGLSIGAGGVVDVNRDNPAPSLPPACQHQVTGCTAASSADHAFAYFRGGGIARAPGGSLHLHDTFVYLADGTVSLTGGTGTVSWEAPGTSRAAPSGPFRDLALWSESDGDHAMSGGSGLALGGLFFTPNALFTYTGSGAEARTRAQLVTFRMKATGSGELQLTGRR